jgi:uroporphyrinogen decarboxylase
MMVPKGRMSPKERVLAQVRHQETDIVPYTLEFETPDLMDRLDAFYGDPGWRTLVDNAIRHGPLPHPWLGIPGEQTGTGEILTDLFGARWAMHKRPAHLVSAPLPAPSLSGYTFPSVADCFQPGWAEEMAGFARAHRDYFVVTGLGFGVFERTWVLRGFEEMLMDVAAAPDFYAELVAAITDHQLQLLDRILETPVDGVLFSDDWGYQEGVLIGAERWRTFLKPHLRRLYDRVHDAGKIALNHVCGSVREIMPDMIEIGLDVLESVQPEAKGMDPFGLKADFGEAITFWGGLGSQSTIPFGTPEDIRERVARLISEMGRGGGYILAPSKGIQPETPPENMAAVVESFLQTDF